MRLLYTAAAEFKSSRPFFKLRALVTYNEFNPASLLSAQPRFNVHALDIPISSCLLGVIWLYATYGTGKYVTIWILFSAPAGSAAPNAPNSRNKSFLICLPLLRNTYFISIKHLPANFKSILKPLRRPSGGHQV